MRAAAVRVEVGLEAAARAAVVRVAGVTVVEVRAAAGRAAVTTRWR